MADLKNEPEEPRVVPADWVYKAQLLLIDLQNHLTRANYPNVGRLVGDVVQELGATPKLSEYKGQKKSWVN